MCAIDITAEQRKTVLALLARHLPNTTAWVYGSRVKWTARPESDLDLVVFATPEQAGRVSDLREAFEESNLPFRVDLFVWDTVPQQFRKAIEAEHVVLVEREELRVGSEWVHCTLADACSAINYGLTASASNDAAGPKFLRITDIVSGQLDWNTVPHVVADKDSIAKYRLYDGDIVIARTGASTGTSLYIKTPPRAVFASYLVRLQAKPDFNARFLAYYLKSKEFGEFIRGVLGDKSAQPNASASTMTAVPLSAPRDRTEQRAIAHVLGTLDDKIELNRRMNQTLEEMARALFKSWFVDFDPVRAQATLKHHHTTLSQGGSDWSVERARAYLDSMDPNIAALFPDSFVDSELGPIPEAWEVKPMGKLCNKPQYGYTASAKNEAVGPKFLRITDINKKAWIEWESIPYCEIIGQDFDKYRLYEGDILIARMADPGHGCMIEEKQQAVFASYLIRFRPLQKRYARLLQYWLRSDAYWELVRERGGGTTRVSLNAKVLSEFSLTVPTCHLIDAFAKQVDSLRVGVVANSIESRALTALRDTLLPKLLSGKVRVSGGTENSGR